MKAAIFYKPNSILPIEDINITSPLKGEVLVKLTAAGVCHSDYHFMTGMMIPPKSPFIMGHEGAGIIEEIGKDVQNIKVGNKVLLSMDAICGKCKNCKLGKETLCTTYGRTFTMPDGTTRFYKNNIKYYHMVGTFSEYTILPADQVIVVPDDSPLEKICISTIENGYMTKDLAILINKNSKFLNTNDFLNVLSDNLKKTLI